MGLGSVGMVWEWYGNGARECGNGMGMVWEWCGNGMGMGLGSVGSVGMRLGSVGSVRMRLNAGTYL